MPSARRIPVPLVLAAAVAAAGFLTGPASASTKTAYVTPSHVMLNPQPLPPRWTDPLSEVALNPQPLPPRYLGFQP